MVTKGADMKRVLGLSTLFILFSATSFALDLNSNGYDWNKVNYFERLPFCEQLVDLGIAKPRSAKNDSVVFWLSLFTGYYNTKDAARLEKKMVDVAHQYLHLETHEQTEWEMMYKYPP